jgi:protease PrsW
VLLILTAVSAIVPSLLLIWYFWGRDVSPEPPRVLWATFGLGVLSILPVLMVELPIAALLARVPEPYLRGALDAFFGAAAPEEAFKLLVLLAYCERHPEFDEPMDGIVYGAVASLGFATLENVLYVGSGGLELALTRALTAVPSHAFGGAILGYYVGQAKFTPKRRDRLILEGYLLAFVLHGLYDFPLLTLKSFKDLGLGEPPLAAKLLVLLTLGALAFEWIFAVSRVRRLRVDQLHVLAVRALQRGVAPPPGVLTAAAPTRGAQVVGWIMLLSGGLFACGGGLVVLVLAGALLLSPPDAPGSGLHLALGGGVIGVLPLVVGLLLFARGLGRLRVQAPISPYVARAG